MAALKGILWDNDGVLVDTERLFYESNRELFADHGVELSEQQFFDWYLADHCGAWHLLRARGYAEQTMRDMRALRNRRHSVRLAAADGLAVAGMAEVVAALAPRAAMGIVTSASAEHFGLIHAKLDFLPHFRFVLTEEAYSESKPSPEPYLLGLSRLGLAADDCVVIEDSPRGVQAAHAAGIRAIVLRTALTRHFPFDLAWRVVDTPAQLLATVQALLD